MTEFIRNLLVFAIPFIQKLIASTVVPKIKRKAYEHLDDYVNDRIEDLVTLVNKIKSTDNEIKKQAHLEGLRLGVDTLRAIGKKLISACDEFEKVLA